MPKQPTQTLTESTSSDQPINYHEGHRKRLKQQLLEHGAETLNDHQLLELLLFYSVPRKDTNPLAHELIHRFGSLYQALRASPEELRNVPGVSDHTIALFSAVPELMRRTSINKAHGITLRTTEEATEYLRPYFLGLREERCILLSLNHRYQVVGCDLLSSGSHREVTLDRQLLINRATSHRAAYVLLAHNHPGNDPFPSDDDLFATQECRNLLKMVGITLKDHFIFTDNDYCSMMGRRKS